MSANQAQLFLLQELQKRKRKNPAYSQRSFSRHLNIPSGRLSEYLSGKRLLSVKMRQKIIGRLNLNEEEAKIFLEEKKEIKGKNDLLTGRTLLSEDIFSLIADWYYYAILSFFETSQKKDLETISAKFKMPQSLVALALHKLEKLGMLKKSKQGLTLAQKKFSTSENIPSKAIRYSHKQSLEHALLALEEIAPELRDFSSVTMAINLDQLNCAKKEIIRFRKRLSQIMEKGNRTEVYKLSIQLFPLTQIDNIKSSKGNP